MRQTTVLLAELSTAAGVRAPLAHIADQVFVDLAREIEAQGVSRKVAADMFGLALRTYQKKMERLTASGSERGKTLWQSVLDHVEGNPGVSRREVLRRFDVEGERSVVGILTDLVGSGILYSSGRGEESIYRPTTTLDRAALAGREQRDGLYHLAWLSLYRSGPQTRAALATLLGTTEEDLAEPVAKLLGDGRAEEEGGRLAAATLLIPVGSEQGWEAAVLDHFQAVATAIVRKLRARPRARAEDEVGGGTVTFHVSEGHPMLDEVRGLLARTRAAVNGLWERVEQYNLEQGSSAAAGSGAVPGPAELHFTFYYGQSHDRETEPESEALPEEVQG